MYEKSGGKRASLKRVSRLLRFFVALTVASSLLLLAGCGGQSTQNNGAATGDSSSPFSGAPTSPTSGTNAATGDSPPALGSAPTSPSANTKAGDRVVFGNYNGQAIIWRVLAVENGHALVITESIIDHQRYNASTDITWADCSLRKWLNFEFYEAAFSNAERANIIQTALKHPDNAEYKTSGGADTAENVFLLSIDEANRYFKDNSDRKAKSNDLDYSWWLRSPGSNADRAAYVNQKGEVFAYGGDVNEPLKGVRPAFWFSL